MTPVLTSSSRASSLIRIFFIRTNYEITPAPIALGCGSPGFLHGIRGIRLAIFFRSGQIAQR